MSAQKSKPTSEAKLARATLPLSTSLCSPAMRMVYLDVWVNPDTMKHECAIHDVVALRSMIVRTYSQLYYGDMPPLGSGSEKDLFVDGWSLDEQVERMEALIVFDGSLVGVETDRDQLHCWRHDPLLVCCHWPAEEDEQRLDSTIKEMAAAQVRRIQARQKSTLVQEQMHNEHQPEPR